MRKVLCAIAVSVLFGSYANAQVQDPKDKFIQAEYYFLNEDYEKALPLYLESYRRDTTNFNVAYRIGVCYENIPLKIFQAIPYLEKSIKSTTNKYREGSYRERKASVDAFYHLGYIYQIVRRFDEAIKAFEKFKSLADVREVYAIDEADRRIESCKRGREMIKNPRWAEIENIGNIVNSHYSDINPCVSSRDTTMVFTRITNRVMDANEAFVNRYRILECKREGKIWGKPRDITPDLKADGSYLSVSLSPDGNTLILYKDEYETGGLTELEHGTLFISKRVNDKWTALKKMNGPINTIHEEGAGWISNDGNTFIFSSNRPGSIGGMDLWKTIKTDNTWSEAINMGPEINTVYDEDFPYLINDTLLYFCSDGHDNIGGTDVYYSKLIKNQVWSSPINMSYPINSPADDKMFVPTKDGKVGYYAVERHEGYISFGKSDIYRVLLDPKADNDLLEIDTALTPLSYSPESSLPVSTMPVPMVGVLKLGDNSVLTPAIHITVMHPKDSTVLYKTSPNYETGEFKLELPPGEYTVQVEGDHYDRTTQNLYIAPDGKTNVRFDVKLEHKQVASGEYFKIKAIFFDFGGYSIPRDAQVELERMLALMNSNPSLYIEVVGFSDSKGSEDYNKKLSIKRSKAVIDYLSSKGIDPSRFVSKGMGEEEQIAINENPDGTDNPEGRRLNRRVEMRILKSDNQKIITEDITVPDHLKYKGSIRFSIVLASEDKQLDENYFEPFYAKGLTKVMMLRDGNKYVYYTGDFKEKADAVSTLNNYIEMGLEKAEISDYFKLNRMSDISVTRSNSKFSGIFVVQIRSQFKPCDIATTFPSIKDNVKMHFSSDGYYRYYFGEYKNINEARAACDKIRDLGYTDAFVIDLNRYQSATTKAVAPTLYTIQIFAANNSVGTSKFSNLGNVEERKGADGLYRYTVGKYNTWNQAQTAIEEIKQKGYDGAFISNMKKYE